MKEFTSAREFRNVIEIDEYYLDHDRQSNCCGADVYSDSDICSDCHEHCAVMITCKTCRGEGKIEVLDDSKELQRYITPPTKEIRCEDCNGEGWIEE